MPSLLCLRLRRSICGLAVLCAISLGAVGLAHGDEQRDPTMDKAQKLFNEGIAAFNVGDFQTACPLFEESLKLVPGVGTRGKLAECYERLGRIASAWRLYREVEKLSRAARDDRRRKIARKRARELKRRLSYLTIKAGPSMTADGFKIVRNSKVVEQRVYGIKVAVDPGTHVIKATAPGHVSFNTSVMVKERKSETVVVPELELVEGAVVNREGEVVSNVVASKPPGKARPWTAYALMGGGALVAVGGGTTFGLIARARWGDALDTCPRQNGDPVCPGSMAFMKGEGEEDEARNWANLSNASIILGTAAATVGVILWLRSGNKSRRSDARALHITPTATTESVGVTVWRRF